MIIIATIILAIIGIIGGYTVYEKSKCPEGTDSTNTGGEAKPGCKCPDKKVFLDGTCKDCGSNAVYKDGVCIKCEENAISNIKTSMPTQVYGCYCPEGTAFVNGICQTCLGGSSGSGSGATAMPFGCKCPAENVYTNGQCKSCGSTAVYKDGICINCPQGATTTKTNINTNVENCYCPPDATFDPVLKICKTCLGGSSGDGTSTEVSPGCFCPAGTVYGSNGTTMICKTCGSNAYYSNKSCISCPNGATVDKIDGSVPTDDVNCFCPPNYTFIKGTAGVNGTKGSCQICLGGSSFYDLGGDASPAGCKCPINMVFNPITQKCEPCGPNSIYSNGKCVVCGGGSSTLATFTGPTANITGCNCPPNSIYENDTCKVCPTGTNLTNIGGSYSLLPVCKCPDLNIYDSTIPGCRICGDSSIYNFETKTCNKCPAGSNSIINTSPYTLTNITNQVASCYCIDPKVWSNGSCVDCPPGSTKNISSVLTNVNGCYCPEDNMFDEVKNKCDIPTTTNVYNKDLRTFVTCAAGSNTTNTGLSSNDPSCYCPPNYSYTQGVCALCVPIMINNSFVSADRSIGWILNGGDWQNITRQEPITGTTNYIVPRSTWRGDSLNHANISGFILNHTYSLLIEVSWDGGVSTLDLLFNGISFGNITVNDFSLIPITNGKIIIERQFTNKYSTNNNSITIKNISAGDMYRIVIFYDIKIIDVSVTDNNLSCAYPIIANSTFNSPKLPINSTNVATANGVIGYSKLTTSTKIDSWTTTGAVGWANLPLNNIYRKTNNSNNQIIILQHLSTTDTIYYDKLMAPALKTSISQTIRYFDITKRYTLYITVCDLNIHPSLGSVLKISLGSIILEAGKSLVGVNAFTTYKYIFQPKESNPLLTITNDTTVGTLVLCLESVYVSMNT